MPSATIAPVSETLPETEQMPYGNVHTQDGKWFMRPDRYRIGAEIPPDMAKAISMMVRRSGKQTTERTDALYRNIAINCHRSTFYAMGLIGLKAFVRTGDLASFQLLPDDQFKEEDNLDLLEARLRVVATPGKVGFAQIRGFHQNLIDHSFLFAPDERGKMICFEKEDRYDAPYHIVELDEIYSHWGRFKMLKWAVGAVDDVKDSPEAGALRQYVDERLKKIAASKQPGQDNQSPEQT